MCDLDATGAPSIFKIIRSDADLARIFRILIWGEKTAAEVELVTVMLHKLNS